MYVVFCPPTTKRFKFKYISLNNPRWWIIIVHIKGIESGVKYYQ